MERNMLKEATPDLVAIQALAEKFYSPSKDYSQTALDTLPALQMHQMKQTATKKNSCPQFKDDTGAEST
jgi:Tfp pilus assembly protein PilE